MGCCARQGSRCYVKDSRWASCNETCLSTTKWEGSYHHGRWVHTHYPVWDCTDITAETKEAEVEDVEPPGVEDVRPSRHHRFTRRLPSFGRPMSTTQPLLMAVAKRMALTVVTQDAVRGRAADVT